MRLNPINNNEYDGRVKKLQGELKLNNVDLFIGYSSECESSSSRYLTGFWPFFDFVTVIVPAEGKAALVTGGPESHDFAEKFSRVPHIFINPLLVETSAPEWVPKVTSLSFKDIILKIYDNPIKKIGIGNWNIFPYQLFKELTDSFSEVEFINADNLLLNVQAIKTKEEIPYINEAYRIAQEALETALKCAKPGMKEWEIESAARIKMLEMGAEGTPYPTWVCSGDNTKLSLCRSTGKAVKENELIQLTVGAKYMGYCGNICRPFVIGKTPKPVKSLIEVALEAIDYTVDAIKPGIVASDVFKGYYNILSKYNYENFTLYGPAHGTGSSEVEGLWLAKNADFTIKPGMLFNIDVWLSDGANGIRYEDGIMVTESGIRELTNYRREIIEL